MATLAQVVEQRTENPCVPSSTLGSGTIYFIVLITLRAFVWKPLLP